MIICRQSTRDFSGVDRYKNLLVKKYSAKAGQTIVNNLKGEDYVSLFLACAELGLVTIISEMTPFSEKLFYERKYKIPFYIPEKIALLLPIDYYIGEESIYTSLADTIVDENGWTDDALNYHILSRPDSILFRTSNEKKIIEHTHEYMFSLGKRNSKLLKGNVQVENDIFFLMASLISDVNIQYEYDVTTDIVESIFLRQWVGNVEIGNPIFTKDSTGKMTEVDDYYDIDVIDDRPYMLVPVYDTVGVMSDYRTKKLDDGSYSQLEKSDEIIINNHTLYLNHLNSIANEYVANSTIVYDSQYKKVYLAVWNDQEDLHHKVMKLYYQFEDRFEIARFSVLDQENFINGQDLDYESIRDYFRNK